MGGLADGSTRDSLPLDNGKDQGNHGEWGEAGPSTHLCGAISSARRPVLSARAGTVAASTPPLLPDTALTTYTVDDALDRCGWGAAFPWLMLCYAGLAWTCDVSPGVAAGRTRA